jgi:hypothetical protein
MHICTHLCKYRVSVSKTRLHVGRELQNYNLAKSVQPEDDRKSVETCSCLM